MDTQLVFNDYSYLERILDYMMGAYTMMKIYMLTIYLMAALDNNNPRPPIIVSELDLGRVPVKRTVSIVSQQVQA